MANALRLADAFKLCTLKKITGNVDNLCSCLLDYTSKEVGWLYEHFEKENITADQVYLSTRALLASRCMKNSELSLALSKSLFGPVVNVAVAVDISLLRSVFVITGEPVNKQTVINYALDELIQGFERPDQVLKKLTADSQDKDEGWIRDTWFIPPKRFHRTRLTELEENVLRIQIYLILDAQSDESQHQKALSELRFAWRVSERTMENALGKFSALVKKTLITFRSRQQKRRERNQEIEDGEEFEFVGHNSPSRHTPRQTRAQPTVFSPLNSDLVTPATARVSRSQL
jgi:hypothetical protein